MQATADAVLARKESLRRYRDHLETARFETSRERDKIILTMAGGALTVSAALLENNGTPPTTLATALLLVGWMCEVVAVVMVLYSLHLSERALVAARERADVMLTNDDGEDPKWSNPAAIRTERLNNWSSGLAVVGIVLLLAQAAVVLPTFTRTDRTPETSTQTR